MSFSRSCGYHNSTNAVYTLCFFECPICRPRRKIKSTEMEQSGFTDQDEDNSQIFCEENKIEEIKNEKGENMDIQETDMKEGLSNCHYMVEEIKSRNENELGLIMECEVIDRTTKNIEELGQIELWSLEWLQETDDLVRECTIHLMTTRGPLDGPLAFHWALKFVWNDGYTATYEAALGKGNAYKLTPEWRPGGPGLGDSWRDRVWDEWCAPGYKATPCSPLQVNQVARNLHINSTAYHAVNNNRQKWAKAVAFPFGVELPLGAASTAGRVKLTDTSAQLENPEE